MNWLVATNNKITIKWVSAYKGNEEADKLVKKRGSSQFIGTIHWYLNRYNQIWLEEMGQAKQEQSY